MRSITRIAVGAALGLVLVASGRLLFQTDIADNGIAAVFALGFPVVVCVGAVAAVDRRQRIPLLALFSLVLVAYVVVASASVGLFYGPAAYALVAGSLLAAADASLRQNT